MTTKKCSQCGEEKDTKDYSFDKKNDDGLRFICKLCAKKQSKKKCRDKNLEYNRKDCRERRQRIIDERRKHINKLKSAPCVLCGKCFPPECMDFDHIDPSTKEFEPGTVIWKSQSHETFIKELAKCQVLCCYCHATKSHVDRGTNKNKYVAKRREIVNEIKKSPCNLCGKTYEPWLMQFDHLDQSTKTNCISNMIRSASIERIMEEIEKCQLLCIGCHRTLTKQRQNNKLK